MIHHEWRTSDGAPGRTSAVYYCLSSEGDPHANRDIDAASDRSDSISQTRRVARLAPARAASPPLRQPYRSSAAGWLAALQTKYDRATLAHTRSAPLAAPPSRRPPGAAHPARPTSATRHPPLSINPSSHSPLLLLCSYYMYITLNYFITEIANLKTNQ